MVLKFDAMRERNFLGGFVAVALIALSVSRFFNDGPLGDSEHTNSVRWMLIWIPLTLLALVALLQTHKIEVDFSARRVRVKRGFWLFAKWQEESFTTPKALKIGSRMTRYGPMYDVWFVYDNEKSVPLLNLGYEGALKRLIKLTEPTKIPLQASPELAQHGPRWLKAMLGQR